MQKNGYLLLKFYLTNDPLYPSYGKRVIHFVQIDEKNAVFTAFRLTTQ